MGRSTIAEKPALHRPHRPASPAEESRSAVLAPACAQSCTSQEAIKPSSAAAGTRSELTFLARQQTTKLTSTIDATDTRDPESPIAKAKNTTQARLTRRERRLAAEIATLEHHPTAPHNVALNKTALPSNPPARPPPCARGPVRTSRTICNTPTRALTARAPTRTGPTSARPRSDIRRASAQKPKTLRKITTLSVLPST